MSKKIGKEHIVVIGKFEERRSFKLFLQDLTSNNDLTIYQTKTEFNIYPEYNEYALAFQVTKDLAINNICITDKSNTELSADYLKLIEKKIQQFNIKPGRIKTEDYYTFRKIALCTFYI